MISEISMQRPLQHNPRGTTPASRCACLLTDPHGDNELGEIMNLKQGGEKKSTKPGVIPLSGLFVLWGSSVLGKAENCKERREEEEEKRIGGEDKVPETNKAYSTQIYLVRIVLMGRVSR